MNAQEAGAELNSRMSGVLARYHRHHYFLKGNNKHQIAVVHSHNAHRVAMDAANDENSGSGGRSGPLPKHYIADAM